MGNIQVWILTFNRSVVLNRLVKRFNSQKVYPHIFSNHPVVSLEPETEVSRVVVNTLNSVKSNSWCARSWNSIFLKAFENPLIDGVVCIQDDTDIRDGWREAFVERVSSYDFISAPAGDQFFYIHKNVLKKVGWFDERYIGCYCGDADYFKRVYLAYDKGRVSQYDTHNWGWKHNPCGIEKYLDTEFNTKTCQPGYENQHWELEKLDSINRTLKHSQTHYERKWGVELDCGYPANEMGTTQQIPEIDWYPWATKEFNITRY